MAWLTKLMKGQVPQTLSETEEHNNKPLKLMSTNSRFHIIKGLKRHNRYYVRRGV